MSASAVEEGKKAGSALLSEERFWERYSPHGEAPLSFTGSLALHALVIGGLILPGVYLAPLFLKPERKVRVEPVKLEAPGPAERKGGVGPLGAKPGWPDEEPDELPGEVKIDRAPPLTKVEIKRV